MVSQHIHANSTTTRNLTILPLEATSSATKTLHRTHVSEKRTNFTAGCFHNMRQPALLVFNVFSDCCVVAHDASEQSSAVYRAYRDYCARNDETARNQRDFYKVLDEAGFTRSKFGNKYMVVHGMQLRADLLQ